MLFLIFCHFDACLLASRYYFSPFFMLSYALMLRHVAAFRRRLPLSRFFCCHCPPYYRFFFSFCWLSRFFFFFFVACCLFRYAFSRYFSITLRRLLPLFFSLLCSMPHATRQPCCLAQRAPAPCRYDMMMPYATMLLLDIVFRYDCLALRAAILLHTPLLPSLFQMLIATAMVTLITPCRQFIDDASGVSLPLFLRCRHALFSLCFRYQAFINIYSHAADVLPPLMPLVDTLPCAVMPLCCCFSMLPLLPLR